ncbi:class I SAM-dependent methyltransferase [Curtobacterium flaccumfaciens]|uniref:class I SAM-dependent methyltransferase n=1 Tax=Curtobacterium flaccumfaciens TaxID=2035 RepID=UPI001BDF589B|nr:class I SAM-dependent methyltransferase [Curtobacterium flaccumfaciens]MBT1606563.1 methyltransferase domain-containing protein [Curtobacterium flaccumfaciens pv. betae]MBT1658029.1 methyltransferase domain-containing protein [Curtobacterium flaccumfaciens pv. betae]MCS0471391.1 class I SAM-dependent methyltransferase [Curtobacterium flaccumfaciens pv. betae]MCS0476054.1 class I SAM-dependent methyltransferase [Curtobacterium flaccumfaciens pv. betae]MCS0477478.1 class I SAM-dependent methy
MTERVTAAYSARADEYAALLGSMDAVHPDDRALVDAWAAGQSGALVDAGCGPGHWTAHLARQGHRVSGIDAAPEFVEHARRTHGASVDFRVGSLDALPLADGSVDGVLGWYSVIHHEPSRIGGPLDEFRRVLTPGGGLLLGFFEGDAVEAFDHAVVTAYRWPVASLAALLDEAGFDVVDVHTRTDPGHRPHGAISAVRR